MGASSHKKAETKSTTTKGPDVWAFELTEDNYVYESDLYRVGYGHMTRNGVKSGGDKLYILAPDRNGVWRKEAAFDPQNAEAVAAALKAAVNWMES